METRPISEALVWLEKANANLEPELLSNEAARDLLNDYARAEKLASFGKAVLASKLDNATEVARVCGTSVTKAKAAATVEALNGAEMVRDAFKDGQISLDQADEIAKAERARPGTASELLPVATGEAFHVLRDRARRIVLEAEQSEGLAQRQRAARAARSYQDDLGMINIRLTLEPHVGTPLVSRAEAEAARYARDTTKQSREPFERYLADAYARLMSGTGTTRTRRPELVVLISHEVVKRGWEDVRDGEVCKIPGVGPLAPKVAKEIAADAFLTGVFFDGKDLRHLRRWTRSTPIEVLMALELGLPPDFDGIRCVDCGNRFRTEIDHVDPHCAGNPASTDNLEPRCYSCHRAKTERDRRAGRLRGPEP